MSLDPEKDRKTYVKGEGDGKFREVFFGKLVSTGRVMFHVASQIRLFSFVRAFRFQIMEGTARSLISKFDVKKRIYYGNTSMEAEISLLMANQTLVSRLKHFRFRFIFDLHQPGLPRKAYIRPICWNR